MSNHSGEKLLQQLAGMSEYDLKINPSRMSGTLKISDQYGLKVDIETPVEDWQLFEAESGDFSAWQSAPVSVLKEINKFVADWEKLGGTPVKDPLDNLKAGGFDLSGAPAENPVDDSKEAWQEEKNRLSREEAEKKLEMAEEARAAEEVQNEQLKTKSKNQLSEKSDMFTDRPTEYVEAPSPKTGEVNLFEVLNKICKNDLMQIFGNTGTGKTSLCTKLALDSKSKGKSVLYIDTEHNINDDQVSAMQKAGIKYEYINKFQKLYDYVKRLSTLQKYNVVIIDSIGAPALAAFCKSDMKGKGDVLQKLISMSDELKEYATDNNSLVVATNQPESSMNKGEKDILEPFGEKSRYYYKEILKTNYAKDGRKTGKTSLVLRAHRSRFMGINTDICTMEVTDKGMVVMQ